MCSASGTEHTIWGGEGVSLCSTWNKYKILPPSLLLNSLINSIISICVHCATWLNKTPYFVNLLYHHLIRQIYIAVHGLMSETPLLFINKVKLILWSVSWSWSAMHTSAENKARNIMFNIWGMAALRFVTTMRASNYPNSHWRSEMLMISVSALDKRQNRDLLSVFGFLKSLTTVPVPRPEHIRANCKSWVQHVDKCPKTYT